MKKNSKPQHGGFRVGSGRRPGPPPPPSDLIKVTCMLRKDTVQKLREGAGGRFFGEFLQTHLDRFPVPDRATYLALKNRQPLVLKIKGRKTPVIVAAGAANRVKRPPKPMSEFEKAYQEQMLAEESA